MTPAEAVAWIAVIFLGLAGVAGFAACSISAHTSFMKEITKASLALFALGLVGVLAPKWTAIEVSGYGLKVKIAQLEKEVAQQSVRLAEYKSQIASLQTLRPDKFQTAAQYYDAIQATGQAVSWANFIPEKRSSYMLSITGENAGLAQQLARTLGTDTNGLANALQQTGFELLAPATQERLTQAQPTDLWVQPQ